MRRVLMCPPTYFGIEYEINPWMSRGRKVDGARAGRQWEELFNLLRDQLGFSISLLEPRKGLPDLVFTANAGLVHGNTFVPSHFRHPERREEAPVFRGWFEKEGYRIRPLPPDLCFEGEGDVLRLDDRLFAGYRIRSDIQSHEHISRELDMPVLSLELVDHRFYHLDTCFCPLAGDTAAYHPSAFDSYARKVIEKGVPRKIEVAPEEALRFACNAVVAGRKAVLPAGSGKLKGQLAGLGYEVWETDLSEFIKAGGAAKCLVLFLD
ncbi:MAG: amidinotransferase [Deltaproteobacteria bacterium]|nr:amidinotransferase [Deltaproteobacteria bacterium]